METFSVIQNINSPLCPNFQSSFSPSFHSFIPASNTYRCFGRGKPLTQGKARPTWILVLIRLLSSCVTLGKTLPFSELHSLHLKMGIDIPANTTQWGVWHLVGTHLMLVKLGFWRASNEVVDGQVIRKKDQRQTQSPALLSWSLTLSSSSSIWRQQIRSPLPSHQAPSAAKETGERFINHLG